MKKAEGGQIVVPELELLANEYTHKYVKWSEYDEALLMEYKGKVDIVDLAKFLRRSVDALEHKARRLGLSK